MNTNYSSLRTVATILNIAGWLQVIGSIIMGLFTLLRMGTGNDPILILDVIGIYILIGFLSVIWFAFAQFIKLCINAADHIETTNNNIYVIATKIEEYFNKSEK